MSTYLNRKALEEQIQDELKQVLSRNFRLHISDDTYYLPSIEEAQRLMDECKASTDFEWCDEVFDCDDFAVILKAHFCRDAYKNRKRRHSHCFGIVWGMIPRPHALNWMINDDMKLRFIDPMYDEIYSPDEAVRQIWMMII